MGPVISPRQLADAIGVSESSLKRWADDGLIRVARTSGGHRRIPIGEAIRFIRSARVPLLHPEGLGLPDLGGAGNAALGLEPAGEQLFAALCAGQARLARGLLLGLYLRGQSVAEIGDDAVRPALQRVGELWRHDPAGIFLEHRATEICIQAVQQLRQLVEPLQSSLTALGGAPSRDPYILPSLLVASTLAAEGWHAINLGPDTPLETLLEAALRDQPALVWLSVSAPQAPDFADRVASLAQRLGSRGCRLVTGGQSAPGGDENASPSVRRCRTLAELVTFAAQIVASADPSGPLQPLREPT